MKKSTAPNVLPIWQVILFNAITLGVYGTYWYFRTWKQVKKIQKADISPGWRTAGLLIPILNIFIAYNLFKRIYMLARDKNVKAFHPALLIFGIPIVGALVLSALSTFNVISSSLINYQSLFILLFIVIVPLAMVQYSLNLVSKDSESNTETVIWRRKEIIACAALILLSLTPHNPIVEIARIFATPMENTGNGMVSTLNDREYITVNKILYLVEQPKRGDVVAFHPPHDEGKIYVKRIIGLPGENITIRDGKVFLISGGEGEEIELIESYLNERNRGLTYQHPPMSGNTQEIQYIVPNGSFFLLGDNRQGSLDSRSFRNEDGNPQPYVSHKAIIGKVTMKLLPYSKAGRIENPSYNIP